MNLKLLIGFICVPLFAGAAFAQNMNWVEDQLAQIEAEIGVIARSGCEGSRVTGCSCTASGAGASCICEGSGNGTICKCEDANGPMYCYHCGGTVNRCQCTSTRPNNPGQVPCNPITMSNKISINSSSVAAY